MMPAVSVIVLVYKVEKYIERCARALFGQTMEDIEYVFVDDCTPDASMEMLERVLDEFPQRRSRVKVLRNDVNRGRAYSRRRGVGAASGEYIIHCDSDDWPEPDMYGKLYAKAVEGGLDMVVCRMRRLYPDHVGPVPCMTRSDDLLESLLCLDIQHYLLDKLVSRKLYDAMEWPEHDMCEDTAIMIQLAYRCRSWGFVDVCLYNYNYTPEGISSSGNTVKKLEQIRSNVDMALSFLEEKGLGGKYAGAAMHLKCRTKIRAFDFPRRYYLGLYPEANLPLFFDRRIPLKERLGHMTKMLGIHGISKPFVRKRK